MELVSFIALEAGNHNIIQSDPIQLEHQVKAQNVRGDGADSYCYYYIIQLD